MGADRPVGRGTDRARHVAADHVIPDDLGLALLLDERHQPALGGDQALARRGDRGGVGHRQCLIGQRRLGREGPDELLGAQRHGPGPWLGLGRGGLGDRRGRRLCGRFGGLWGASRRGGLGRVFLGNRWGRSSCPHPRPLSRERARGGRRRALRLGCMRRRHVGRRRRRGHRRAGGAVVAGRLNCRRTWTARRQRRCNVRWRRRRGRSGRRRRVAASHRPEQPDGLAMALGAPQRQRFTQHFHAARRTPESLHTLGRTATIGRGFTRGEVVIVGLLVNLRGAHRTATLALV